MLIKGVIITYKSLVEETMCDAGIDKKAQQSRQTSALAMHLPLAR